MKAARNVVARTIIVQVTTEIGSASSSLHSRSNGLIVSKYRQNSLFCIFTQNFSIIRDKTIYMFSQTYLFSGFFGLSHTLKVITNISGSFSPSLFLCKHFKEGHIQNIQKRRSIVNPGTSLQYLYDMLRERCHPLGCRMKSGLFLNPDFLIFLKIRCACIRLGIP